MIPEKIPWGREWQPTSASLPGEFHGQRSLEGYSPWGHKKLDMTEQLSFHSVLTSLLSPRKAYSSQIWGSKLGSVRCSEPREPLCMSCSHPGVPWSLVTQCVSQQAGSVGSTEGPVRTQPGSIFLRPTESESGMSDSCALQRLTTLPWQYSHYFL